MGEDIEKLMDETEAGPWELVSVNDVKILERLGINFCSNKELKLINEKYSIIQVTGEDIFSCFS